MIDVKLAGGRLVSIAPEESFMSNFDLTLSIMLGVGLAAATGFRVFLPMLIVSVTSYTGHLSLGDSFAWLGTPAALTMLGAAALAEIAAYYIPGVDNLLDALATPAAFVAGTIVSAAVMTDLPPMVKWTAAIIAGGGVAGLTQGVTATLRANSTIFTGGIGNMVLATLELGGALLVSLLALAAPLAALAVVLLFLWVAIRLLRRLLRAAHRSMTRNRPPGKCDLGIARRLRPTTPGLAVAAEARVHRDLCGAAGGAVSGNAHPPRSAREHATIVRPETLVRWHRAGFRRYWRWKSRSLGGRPQIGADLRALIRRMSDDNPLWGAPRIHGELLRLGFEVAQSSVAKYMVKRRGPPSPGWRTFLRSHAPDIAAMDLFIAPTIGFDLLYVLVIVQLERRKLVWINVTPHPTAEWIARQITEAFPWSEAPRYLIRDRVGFTALLAMSSSHFDR